MGAPAIILYVLSILLSVTLQEKRTQIVVFNLAIFSYLLLAFLHHYTVITAIRSDETAFLNRILIMSSGFAGVVGCLRFLIGQLEREIAASRASENELSKTNVKLQILNAELKTSEERFFKSFHANPAPMAISEIETSCFIDANSQWINLLGYSREETVGAASLDLGIWAEPEDRNRMIGILKKESSLREVPVRYRTKDGVQKEILWSAEIITLGQKKVLLSLVYDNTRRMKAESALRESEERLRLIGDNLPGGMIFQVVKEQGKPIRFSHVSAGAAALHGYTPEEIIEDASRIFAQVYRDDVEGLWREIRKAGSQLSILDTETRFVIGDGEMRWYRIIWRPRKTEDGSFIADGIEFDVTNRKKDEAEIRRLYEEMEKKVFERTAELDAANSKLLAKNAELAKTLSDLAQAQSQIVQSEKLSALGQLSAGLAHEMNTPLGAIISSNQSALELMKERLPEVTFFLLNLTDKERCWFRDIVARGVRRSLDPERPFRSEGTKKARFLFGKPGSERGFDARGHDHRSGPRRQRRRLQGALVVRTAERDSFQRLRDREHRPAERDHRRRSGQGVERRRGPPKLSQEQHWTARRAKSTWWRKSRRSSPSITTS